MADQVTQDALEEMSDDDFLNAEVGDLAFNSSAATEEAPTTTDEAPSTTVEGATEEEQGKADEDGAKADNDGEQADKEEGQEDGPEAGKTGDAPSDDAGNPVVETKADDGKGEKAPKDEPSNGQPAGTAPATPAAVDLTAFHAAITGKFMANGREMQVESAEEAIQLMQMGAGFGKKMAALKPNLKLMKMLDKAGLLSEEQIGFLIDVASKKPDAISKLVKDAGIDPLDISDEKAGGYTPGDYRVTDDEQALDEAFDALEGTEGFDRTLDVIGKQWDQKSRGLIAKHPQALHDITQHIRAGVFDVVIAKVERERTFGRLTGLSDLEAYRQVGSAMAESGELKHLTEKATPSSQPAAPAKVVAQPKPKQADDANRRAQRQAASPTRATSSAAKGKVEFDPLSMSDEEIMKLDISKFQ